jgi:hypothetical protein
MARDYSAPAGRIENVAPASVLCCGDDNYEHLQEEVTILSLGLDQIRRC